MKTKLAIAFAIGLIIGMAVANRELDESNRVYQGGYNDGYVDGLHDGYEDADDALATYYGYNK